MNPKGIMIIAIRIGAIVIAVNVIELFPVHFNSYTIQGSFHWFPFIGFLVLPTLITLLIAASMWVYPQVLLKKFSFGENLKESIEIVPHELGSILIAVIGLYILSFSISDIFYHITYIRVTYDHLGSDYRLSADTIAMVVATIVEIILGIFLIFGSKIITNLILRFRKELKGSL